MGSLVAAARQAAGDLVRMLVARALAACPTGAEDGGRRGSGRCKDGNGRDGRYDHAADARSRWISTASSVPRHGQDRLGAGGAFGVGRDEVFLFAAERAAVAIAEIGEITGHPTAAVLVAQ